MSYMSKVYWGIVARLFPAYHAQSIQRDLNKMADIFMRETPLQRALREENIGIDADADVPPHVYPAYGGQVRGSMPMPKDLNDTPHWDYPPHGPDDIV